METNDHGNSVKPFGIILKKISRPVLGGFAYSMDVNIKIREYEKKSVN